MIAHNHLLPNAANGR